MTDHGFPGLVAGEFENTRDALQAYSKILGDYLKACRARRKHWWHASLRLSLHGATTGVVYAGPLDFEIELDLRTSQLIARTARGEHWTRVLHGQPAATLATELQAFLVDAGLPSARLPAPPVSETGFSGYSSEQASRLGRALATTAVVLDRLRAAIREEAGPIGLWPHHFDLAMLWLAGGKIEGQDPADEEFADRQMNFGFTFGDSMLSEPYFYATAYPLPEGFPETALVDGAEWYREGFTGMVWRYASLREGPDAAAALLAQWQALLDEGRRRLGD
ncbi:MAG: DUF5996 family protein [Gammaproteobacteria bacterium]|nr:DUF5996 family protein [Gammaproteobacteria bacterium]